MDVVGLERPVKGLARPHKLPVFVFTFALVLLILGVSLATINLYVLSCVFNAISNTASQ